jgi:hypothetical protein
MFSSWKGVEEVPMYELAPVEDRLWHADWASSEHEGACVVSAEDEEHARRLAARRFRAPVLPPYVGDPWTRLDLVTVHHMAGFAHPLPLGWVLPIMNWKAG